MIKAIILYVFLVVLLALGAGWLSLAINGKTLRFGFSRLHPAFIAGYQPDLGGWRVARIDSYPLLRSTPEYGRNYLLFTRWVSFEFEVRIAPRAVLNVKNDEGVGVA